ncbi:hypothetical protein CASFOL_035264 [Castilleja foliolosa]|uniref:Response regulatory domain-containing protein n=1 Tax=Castilleja foliolosa TaxID=1961234 RepID=A0ABD3BSV3_9LAMI
MEEEEASSSTPKFIKSSFVDKPHILLVDYNLYERNRTAYVFEANSCKVTKTDCELHAMNILLNEERTPNKMAEIDMVCMEFAPHHLYAPDKATWLLRSIKESAALREMPVVIVTDKSYYEYRCKELNALAYFYKPMKTYEVMDLMRHMDWMPRNIMETGNKRSARFRESCNMQNNSKKKPAGALRLG